MMTDMFFYTNRGQEANGGTLALPNRAHKVHVESHTANSNGQLQGVACPYILNSSLRDVSPSFLDQINRSHYKSPSTAIKKWETKRRYS